jgi:hypothetical protein
LLLSLVPNIFGSLEIEHNVTVLNSTAYGDTTKEYGALTSLVQSDLAIIIGIGSFLVFGMLFILAKVVS